MDAATLATWALVAATVVLALATAALVRYARAQAKQMEASGREAARQTAALQAQGQQLEESLAVSREMLGAARAERAAAAPLALIVDLRGRGDGAQVTIRNAARDVVMYLSRVEIRKGPNGPLLLERDLADAPLDVHGGRWQTHLAWEHPMPNALIEVRATGHRQEGPTTTREFLFRVAENGLIINLARARPGVF